MAVGALKPPDTMAVRQYVHTATEQLRQLNRHGCSVQRVPVKAVTQYDMTGGSTAATPAGRRCFTHPPITHSQPFTSNPPTCFAHRLTHPLPPCVVEHPSPDRTQSNPIRANQSEDITSYTTLVLIIQPNPTYRRILATRYSFHKRR